MSRWILRRLQKRVEREWREYEHVPTVSFGPLLPGRRASRGETQVYRSFVQIHFHPRSRAAERRLRKDEGSERQRGFGK